MDESEFNKFVVKFSELLKDGYDTQLDMDCHATCWTSMGGPSSQPTLNATEEVTISEDNEGVKLASLSVWTLLKK